MTYTVPGCGTSNAKTEKVPIWDKLVILLRIPSPFSTWSIRPLCRQSHSSALSLCRLGSQVSRPGILGLPCRCQFSGVLQGRSLNRVISQGQASACARCSRGSLLARALTSLPMHRWGARPSKHLWWTLILQALQRSPCFAFVPVGHTVSFG